MSLHVPAFASKLIELDAITRFNHRVLIKVQYGDLAVVLLNLQPIKPEAIVLAVRKPTPGFGLAVTKHRALNGGGADVAHRGELLGDPDACSGWEC
ncbi:MAG: hypothetical protein RI986_1057 [Planctomycetota bacterium]|jgi:hypothetical protein